MGWTAVHKSGLGPRRHMKKVLAGLAIIVAYLACGWFGFWFGFTEMFYEHEERRYSSDVAELVVGRHWVRCLEEDSSKALANMKADLKLRRESLMLTTPQELSVIDRVKLAADPRLMWTVMQDQDDLIKRRSTKTAFVMDESRPAECAGAP